MPINIAIDGPSAAGKSTIADKLAEKLGYSHLDTGAMYRCVAYMALEEGVDIKDEDAVVSMMDRMVIDMRPNGEIILNGKKVNDEIRTDLISISASDVSAFKEVREKLVRMQQALAVNKGVIMDGRDIGTVVLPDAELKVFLTASPEARAERRYKQNIEKGFDSDYNQILEEIVKRDYNDSHRENSPLKKADDAIEIDSSNLSIDEVLEKIEEAMPL